MAANHGGYGDAVNAGPVGPTPAAVIDNTGGAVSGSSTLAALSALSTGGGNTYSDAAVNAKLTVIANSLSTMASVINTIIAAL